MSERPEIVPFDLSDRPCRPEILVGMDGIFSKPSHFVTFRNLEGQTDSAIYSIFQEKHVEGRSRESLRAPRELTRSGQGIGHFGVERSRCPNNVGGSAPWVSQSSGAARTT
jgi:hypothetical protein